MDYDQTHWAPVQRRRPLPTFYYHEHFVEMLDFVAEHYAHVLLEAHAKFISDFRSLSREAQCLYVRLANRKGRLFARNKLQYPELGRLEPLLDALGKAGWVGAPDTPHHDEVLTFLTRSEIYAMVTPRFPGISRSLKKVELIDFVQENMAPGDFVEALDTDRILVQRRADTVRSVRTTHAEFLDIPIAPQSPAAGKTVVDCKLPRTVVLVAIRRGAELLIPHGDTVLMAGDIVTVLCERDHADEVKSALV